MTMTKPASVPPRALWNLAVRRKWLIGGIILLSLGIAWTLCQVLPKSYRSTTLIMVEQQKIPERYVQGVIAGNVQDRLSLIQQQVTSRTMLQKVIENLKLYQNDLQHQPLEDVIQDMRKAIKVETKGFGRVDAFSISFAHETPLMAMKVTEKLASQFIEENLKLREQFVEGAIDFLDHELNDQKALLEAKERVMSEFKKLHMGALPGQLEVNLRTLDRLQHEHIALQESLARMQERLEVSERAINEYEAPGGMAAGAQSGHVGEDPLLARLRELERSALMMSAEYKDTYPDIIHLKQEIAKVKAQLAHTQAAGQPDKAGATDVKQADATKTFDSYFDGLLKQRDNLRFEIAALKERINRTVAEKLLYQTRVEVTPAREQELAILERDYDNMQKNYQSLLDKKLGARIAESLEKRQKGEQFRMIDPANLPTTPEKPDQLRIMLLGLAVGCGLGGGLAVVLEQINPVFRRSEEAENALGLPVLATIPTFQNLLPQSKKPFSRSTALPEGSQGNKLLSTQVRLVNGNGKQSGEQAGPSISELSLVARWRPDSAAAEQFRVAATRLVLMAGKRENTVIVVTSALKGEGKSATAANVAYMLARDLGKSTILIDCDLKRPMLHAYTGIVSEPGLAEALHGDCPIDECFQHFGEVPLSILPAGSIEKRRVSLFELNRLSEFLPQLRERFKFIIIDAPPIIPLADMNVLASLADILALVVRAEVTEREIVRKALNILKPTCEVALILTGLWERDMPYYMQEQYYGSTIAAKGFGKS
jgi:polysaccharide chain length determinant protein (PEP-CTERM system associated)